jgi:outer membrane protein
MKKKGLLLLLAFFGLNFVYAQKFGYIDSDFILSKMPEYRKAQDEMGRLAAVWEKEIEEMAMEIESKYNSLQAEEVLLTTEMKQDRIKEIRDKENAMKDYQTKIFGYDGLYFLKKQELIKPIQDQVWEAVEKVSKQKRLAFIFDKAGDLVMIYTDPRHDYTDFVLEELGLGDPNDTIK